MVIRPGPGGSFASAPGYGGPPYGLAHKEQQIKKQIV
jgi:hypothetical protein